MDKERKRRRFSDEYKAETVRLIQRSGKSIGQLALELGVGETALRRWVEQAEVEAGRGPVGALKYSEREELVELRRENQRLRMEREILKNGLVRNFVFLRQWLMSAAVAVSDCVRPSEPERRSQSRVALASERSERTLDGVPARRLFAVVSP